MKTNTDKKNNTNASEEKHALAVKQIEECETRIKTNHGKLMGIRVTALETAKDMGKDLTEIQKTRGKQEKSWKEYVADTFEFSYQSAAVYMRIHREWKNIDLEKVKTLDEAIRTISNKSKDSKELNEFIETHNEKVEKQPVRQEVAPDIERFSKSIESFVSRIAEEESTLETMKGILNKQLDEIQKKLDEINTVDKIAA